MSRRATSSWRLALAVAAVVATGWHAASATEPRGRVQLEVSLAGAPSSSEGFGYFVPGVARTFAEALQKEGVVIAGPTDAVGAIPLHLTVEERPGDRVLLGARLRGRRVETEGAVDQIEDLVVDLAGKVAPWCVEGATAASRAAAKNAKVADAGVPAHGATHAVAASTGPETTAPPAATTTTPTTASPIPTPPSNVTTPPSSAPSAVIASPTPPVATPPLVGTPAATTTTPSPTSEEHARKAADLYGPDARVAEPSSPGFVRGRVVVHTVLDPSGGYAGSGSAATQALYAVLQRRLHLSIVPMGTGFSSPGLAADEGQRAQARAVVMARVDAFSVTAAEPLAVRLRFEIEVVREGRTVMRRAVATESPALPPLAGRGRAVDPTYLAVAHALEGMLPELTGALAGWEPR